MTRKDYTAIAQALSIPFHCMTKTGYERELSGVRMSVMAVANELELNNPSFDRYRFLAVVRGERELGSRSPRKGAA